MATTTDKRIHPQSAQGRTSPNNPRTPNSPGESSKLELMGLAYETARHYGNMRFTMFTVFTAVVGALMAAPLHTHKPVT